MAAKTRYLDYTIHLTTRSQVTSLQAQYPDGVRMAPATAATTYTAPIQHRFEAFSAPCCRSDYFWAPMFGGVDVNFPQSQATFTRKTGGWFGISFLFGDTTTYIWVGKFQHAVNTAEIDGVPTEIVAMAQRRWILGWEDWPEGTTANAYNNISRDASRHPDGLGWAYRGDSGSFVVSVTTFKPGNTSRDHWDRFYIRPRKAPAAALSFWLSNGGNSNDGLRLDLLSGLTIGIQNVASGTAVLLASAGQLVLNEWAKIDVVMSYATAGAGVGAYVKVYQNGELIYSKADFTGTGIGSAGAYLTSRYGGGTGGAGEYDLDDCIGSEIPIVDSLGRYAGKDWLNGSKVVRLSAKAFGPGHDAVNWTNQEYSRLNVSTNQGNTAHGMVSSVAAATVVITTDAAQKIDALENALGIAAMVVHASHGGTTSGAHSLGFKIAGGVLDLTVMPASVGFTHERVMYRPAAITDPIKPVDPLTIHYLKDNDATADRLDTLGGEAEVIGTFGQEDVFPSTVADPTTMPRRALGAHNSCYPESPWSRLVSGPPGTYIIHSGTYVGNGLGQDIFFRCPVHWFFLRRDGTGTVVSNLFISAQLASTSGVVDTALGTSPVRAMIDPDFGTGAVPEDTQEQRTLLRITGAQPPVNESGVTYHYVAVSDPLGRFLLTGALGHGAAYTAPLTDILPNATFAPESGFFNFIGAGSGAGTILSYFKGLGHAAAAASRLDLTQDADFLEWAAGLLTPKTDSTVGVNPHAGFALWRRNDGSADALARGKCIQLGTYVGDGTASRTVSFGPIGVRPLFLIVTPANAQSIMRDPGHTGTTSKPISGINNASTGITAGGIDSFSVGSVLNANGIVYSWLLLPGSATAGNGGWSIHGEFIPVEPDTPFDGPFPIGDGSDDPEEGPQPDPDPDPGEDDTDDCEAGDVCIAATTRLANVALTRIGVTKMMTNYCTQLGTEAQIVRALYEVSVRQVLRDFPWPFATKYATLVLAATQQVNDDWAFTYRQPSDCIFERRLVVERGTGVDPKGPPFMLSSDASGGLIFTNEPNAFLEYTCRPTCVAFTGDTLYREALAWHLAYALAPPLTRMTDVAKHCKESYDLAIAKAHDIIKPGVPGTRTTPDPAGPDAGAACILANIEVANIALLRIGARTIANLATEQSREAAAVNLVFERELRSTLRAFSWRFAKRYNEALVLVGGTATVMVNVDWQYSFRLPTDYVAVRRLATLGTGRNFDAAPKVFEVGTDATGPLLFTHEDDPLLEYTARIPCAVSQADELFIEAFAWRLAWALAPSLAQVDPAEPEQHGRGPEDPPSKEMKIRTRPNLAAMRRQVQRDALVMYERTLQQAKIADANESEPEDPPDAEWIRGR